MKKLNVVYFGTPDFSVPSLEILAHHPSINLKHIVSMPDRKAGRGMELKSPETITYAKDSKISFFQTDNINKESEFLDKLETEKIDAIIVLAFAQFLGDRILKLPTLGCFNIHTSLLPKYRGAAPIQYAILNGDNSSGVSIQKMVKQMDAGDLVWSHPVEIHPDETGGLLYTKLKFQAALSLNDFIYKLENDELEFTKQDENNVSFAPTLKREDGFLDFKNQTYQQIKYRVQALFPWPGTYCSLNSKRLKIYEVQESDHKLNPGEVFTRGNQLLVGTKDSSIRLVTIQLEGKKRCKDFELLNGFKSEFIINK